MPTHLRNDPIQGEKITKDVHKVFQEYGLNVDFQALEEAVRAKLDVNNFNKNTFVKTVMWKFERGGITQVKIKMDDFEKFADKIHMKKENKEARKVCVDLSVIYYRHMIKRFVYQTERIKNVLTFNEKDFDKHRFIYEEILTNGELTEFQIKRQFNAIESEKFLKEKMKSERAKEKMENLFFAANKSEDLRAGLFQMSEEVMEALRKNLV